jgi:hypothetical protein
VLYRFQGGSDGASPFYAGVIAGKDGALYGTTLQGGIPGPFGARAGTVFKLTPPATGEANWTKTMLYEFCSQPNCSDGSFPYAGLIADKEGALYGTTGNGGSSANSGSGYGTVFKLTPPTPGQTAWTETVLYSFKAIPDGASPWAGLIANNAGALYGTTLQGGINGNIGGGYGTVFKLTPER